MTYSWKSFCVAKLAILTYAAWTTSALASNTPTKEEKPRYVAEKRIIGPITTVAEAESDLSFKARVDTGATTTSVHVENWKIEDESPDMADNVGKKIHFCIKNHRGESEWLTRKIAEISLIKTSVQSEERYKVKMTLCYNDVKKRVLVTLNDRSHMNYPMLLGRNFLEGDFVVDVELTDEEQEAQESSEQRTAARRSVKKTS